MSQYPSHQPPPIAPVPVHTLPTSGLAIASLVMGILSLVSCTVYAVPPLLFGPLAIIFGMMGKGQVKRGEAGGSSESLAKAGFVCGLIGLILAAAAWLIFIGVIVFAAIAAVMSQP